MRLVLFFIALFLASSPVLAQNNGNGNGNGQSQSDGTGNGPGNGHANGQDNGSVNGQGNGNGQNENHNNGSGKSAGQNNNTGHSEGQGKGNGQANGDGQSNGNGQGNGKGSGSSSGKAPARTRVDPDGTVHYTPDHARDAVNAGQAVSLTSLMPDLQARTTGKLIDAELLNVRGFLVYAIKVLRDTGQVTTEYYYAQSGRFIGTEP
ncbi:hypothetical protein [Devosia sp. FJ2-5-3]|uniref:PepSY domain-containing protein n=1 Tax=Devosia sp. FJ2-5-3 TaxID=2976680 RepID=UPI0023D81649|nr:hypothetical protein [Devosia sp. FJ2-5-3]WEJ56897.1 hypothetical protein N0P34_11790 [Devosia sp. FJ2-5-3]